MFLSRTVEPRSSRRLSRLFSSQLFTFLSLLFTLTVSAATARATTINVPAGGDFQAAIDVAQPGDEIVLEAGSVYRGAFVLRRKEGDSFITIRSSRLSELPGAGVRVTPSHAALMPKLTGTAGAAVIATEEGAHHYRLLGLELLPATPRDFIYSLLTLGSDSQTRLDLIPHHLVVDHCYIHGHAGYPTRRAIALNSASTEITNSYIAEIKEVGADSQAIAGWSGPGPYKIINNYLEAAGENILFGGNDPRIHGLVPSDIEIRGNHLFKPLSWRAGEANYDGQGWLVKNLFELKNARRVIVEGNLMEHNWAHGQNGYGVLFTVRNQDGTAPWSTVEDVTFSNNVVRDTTHGVNILGRDNLQQSEQVKRITVSNNIFEMRRGAELAGDFLQMTGAANVNIVHNTVVMGWALKVYEEATSGAKIENNLFMGGGMHGAGMGGGTAMLAQFLPGASVRGNVFGWMDSLAHEYNEQMRTGNRFTPKLGDNEFVDAANDNYRLASASSFKGKATDGTDIGCNFAVIASAMSGAASGSSTPAPVPTPAAALTIAETVLNTASYTGGDFDVQTQSNLSEDKRTRLMLFTNEIKTTNTNASNDVKFLNSTVTNYAETLSVEARTSDGRVVQLPVEFAGSCIQVQLPELNQVNFVLSNELAGAGRVELTLTGAGQRSNTIAINVR